LQNPDAFIVPDNMTDAKFNGWLTLSDGSLREHGGNPNMVSTPSQRAALTAAENVFLDRDLATQGRDLPTGIPEEKAGGDPESPKLKGGG
jgi:hypothetical protein